MEKFYCLTFIDDFNRYKFAFFKKKEQNLEKDKEMYCYIKK